MTPTPDRQPALSIVVPAFNEAGRIEPTLRRLLDYRQSFEGPVEIIVVDDGSTDDTVAVVQRLCGDQEIRLFVNQVNRGKGYSVRRGMLEATGQVILMTDADLSTPIEEYDKLRAALDDGVEVAIGSRDMPESRLDPPQPPLRHFMAIVFRMIRGMLMLRGIRDTQCGFKAFTGDAARRIFSVAREDGFAFDCEALALADRMGLSIREIGVVWQNNTDSRVHPVRDALRMLIALVRIRKQVNDHHPPIR